MNFNRLCGYPGCGIIYPGCGIIDTPESGHAHGGQPASHECLTSRQFELENQQLREENPALRDGMEKHVRALVKLSEENARLKERVARHTEDYDTERRLKMDLADVRSNRDHLRALLDSRLVELNWCINEINRLDPRLAKARWGNK